MGQLFRIPLAAGAGEFSFGDGGLSDFIGGMLVNFAFGPAMIVIGGADDGDVPIIDWFGDYAYFID